MSTRRLGRLKSLFSPKAIRDGIAIWDRGSSERVTVESYDYRTGKVCGTVESDDSGAVKVELIVVQVGGIPISVSISCECGKNVPCAHRAALALEIGWDGISEFAMEMDEDAARPNLLPPLSTDTSRVSTESRHSAGHTALAEERRSQVVMPSHIVGWTRQLSDIQTRPIDRAANPGKPEKYRVLFNLVPTGSHPSSHLKINILKAPVRKNGSIGRTEPYDPFYARRLAGFVTPKDVDIFRLLRGFGIEEVYRTYDIIDEYSTRCLKAVVDTGKCYFTSPDRPPLQWREARKGRFDWLVDDQFKLRPCVVTDPPSLVFNGCPLIYVDTEQNVIGHVETESPMELARGWISAPVIEPEYHESVVEILREQKLPPPPPLPEPEKIDATLRPIIRLCSGLRYGATSHTTPTVINPEDHTHWAEVRFRYGPVLISPHHSDNTIERKIDGKRYRIRRDQAGEKSRMTEIERAGLTYSYYSVPRSGGGPAWIYSERFCENWESWINKGIPILEASGWTIEFDPSCILQRADVHDWFMDIADADQAGHDWFNIDLGIVIDGERVSLLPLLRKILADPHLPTKGKGANAGMMVSLPDHRCIKIPMKRLEKIRELLIELYSINPNSSGPLRVDRLRAAQFAGVDGWRWNGSERVCDLAKKLAQPQMTPVAPPDGLNATLRPYQLDGLTWLQFLREYDLAGVLADDMGLGKTIQTLAHLLTEKRADRLDQPALVVAPTSLMGNWRDETRRFAPDLRLLVLHGSERHEHFEKLADFDLIVTSYQLLARDQEFLMRQPYHTLILDEAQMIKNPSTLYAQAARKLTCRRRLALTGTPMENHLGELWAIFDFLMPGFLGNHTQFRTLFRDPIEKGNDLTRRQILAKRIAPLILRRRKSEVALELPPKNEMIQSIEISGAQRDLYESIRVSMESRVREQIADMGLARSHIVILDALLKLRQVCCDPRLLKIPGAQEIKESAKLEWLVQALPSMVEEGRKILLFSQFTSMLDLIEEKLNELNIRFVRLTGDTRDRDTPVKSFQNGDVPLFMISLKAGGTGLNLTAADTVIHYDPWWNPAVENQATDRAHRIGQDKTVFVYKLITQGTVEEKIHALQERKAQLLAGLLDESGQSTLKLGEDELRALFAPLS